MNNGRGEAEVLTTFSDGYQYSKTKLEESLRQIMALKPTKSSKDAAVVKREDVDFIVNELGIPRSHAEKALVESGASSKRPFVRSSRADETKACCSFSLSITTLLPRLCNRYLRKNDKQME
ncbi:hypothetical protein BDR07DRAFT_1313258 [Suillus spraguei]|nr:hypothetical protein BDR07DRAFT_1313258 [Suillus spraguei]